MSVEPVVTVADLEAMPDDNNRYEVIDGELLMSKSPGVPHQAVSMNLSYLFSKYLDLNPQGRVFAATGIIFSDIDAVIPDLVFIRRERLPEVIDGDRIVAAPDLVIEILSPGPDNRRRDRVVKRQLYAKFGVKEYWIIDLENKLVEAFVLKDRSLDSCANLGLNDTIRSTVLTGFEAPVSAIFSL
ncbi:MAG TPA: Uma2 family endonuclease [Blastocatellia bacterium]|nr:Uma2 family endonuclease [Blastocatellia bacterium]